MKRQFRMWKNVGAVVAIRTGSWIWSSLKVTARSYRLVLLRLTRHPMMGLGKVIPMVEGIGSGARVFPLSP
jgi:hypothetical protein